MLVSVGHAIDYANIRRISEGRPALRVRAGMGRDLYVEIRGDGVHIRWYDPKKELRALDGKHEIVLKIDPESFSRDGAASLDARNLLRITAFAVTMSADGNPKKIQQKREKQLAAGTVLVEDVRADVASVMAALKKAFDEKSSSRLEMVRSSLKRAVLEAHQTLPYEEVEAIVRNALAEAVISS